MPSPRTNVPLGRVILVVFLTLGFWSTLQWIEPLFFLRDDNSTYYLPAFVHSYRVLLEGAEIAQVNLHQYLGIPHLASGQPAVLYPPVYLAVLVASAFGDVRWTIDLLVAAHLVLAALGMLVLLRHLGVGRRGGDVVGAVLWITMPFVVVLSRGWLPFAFAAAFVPWSLWLMMRLLERPGWPRALAYGSTKTLFFVSGYPQMVVYSTLLEGLFWLGTRAGLPIRGEGGTGRATLRQAAALGGAALWTLATSAPLLLPMLRTLDVSFMRQKPLPIEVFAEYPLRLGDFFLAQFLVFREEVFITAGSSIYFVGLPFLAALVYVFAVPRQRRVKTLAVLGLLALVAATPAWRLVYGLPVVSNFRWPAKFFFFFVFASIPAVALVYDRGALRRPGWARAALAVTLGGALAILMVPEWRRSMGDATLDRPVAEYAARLDELCGDGGRVAAFRMDGTLTAKEWDMLAPYLAAYNYATLFGRHQLGGYEPLVSSTHIELGAGMNYTATLPVRRADPRVFRHLAHWGVRCILVPDLPGIHPPFLEAGMQRASAAGGPAADGVVAYRLGGAPIVAWRARPAEDVPFRWTPSGLEVNIDGAERDGGVLRIAVAPLSQWTVHIDVDVDVDVDVDAGDTHGAGDAEWQVDPWAGLVVRVPQGARRVQVRYREPGFELGLWISALAFLGALLAWILGRRGR